MRVKILVATHKNYPMPADSFYLPVLVGKSLRLNLDCSFQGDNVGNNISKKNSTYNELTAIYWGWRNLDLDAMGLVHYRRYLSLNGQKSLDTVLTKHQVEDLLSTADIILPTKRRYYIETNESHYLHAHHHEPFEIMRQAVAEMYPDYISSFEKVMGRTWAHMFNMFIMKKQPLDEYCTWMFSILDEVERRTDISNYSVYEQRVYGFLSELLLDVWLDMNSQYRVQEVKYVFIERTNWLKKGGNFLLRKVRGHG